MIPTPYRRIDYAPQDFLGNRRVVGKGGLAARVLAGAKEIALVGTVSAVLAAGVALAYVHADSQRQFEIGDAPFAAVVVEEGDSISTFVNRFFEDNPDAAKNYDARSVINAIIRYNGLTSPSLQPGQVLSVPQGD